MDSKRLIKVSKYLSKHLRHEPERIGLTLGAGGWVAVADLLAACQRQQFPISRAELDAVVAGNDKQRFAFDSTGTLIRANQGHSVDIDLQLEAATPPAQPYHGTAAHNIESIRAQGLCKMSRHHVHLSVETDTARKVGIRHGKPAIFVVNAAQMDQEGYTFYCSANGVWLVDEVPPCYLTLLGQE